MDKPKIKVRYDPGDKKAARQAKRKAKKTAALTGRVYYTGPDGKVVKNPVVGGKAHYGPRPKVKVVRKKKKPTGRGVGTYRYHKPYGPGVSPSKRHGTRRRPAGKSSRGNKY